MPAFLLSNVPLPESARVSVPMPVATVPAVPKIPAFASSSAS